MCDANETRVVMLRLDAAIMRAKRAESDIALLRCKNRILEIQIEQLQKQQCCHPRVQSDAE